MEAIAITLIVGILILGACVFAGVKSVRQKGHALEATEHGTGLIVNSLFTLLGLLLAFTLSASASRLDNRRNLSINEANAIGTSVLRLNLLPENGRSELQGLFKTYIEDRLKFNAGLAGRANLEKARAETDTLQKKIWEKAIQHADTENRKLLLPVLNEVFDLASSRNILTETKTPLAIMVLLSSLAMLCSFLVGRSIAHHGRNGQAYASVFILAITAAMVLVIDLDSARTGLIRIDEVDSLLRSTLMSLE